MKTKLFKQIESYEAYAVELQRGLTAIPALAPSSGGDGEYDKAKWLEGELKKLKFDSIEWINAPQKEAKNGVRPNIVARYKGKNPGKTLWLMSHLDIVPPGEAKLWNSDPYKMVIKGRHLIGRGVEDNQQATVSSILVAKAMMELDYRPEFDLALLFCADEETGSGFGADYIAEHKPETFGKNDMFFIPDSGTEDGSTIEIAEKSIMWLKFQVKGRQCHASRPSLGINAMKAGAELIVLLDELNRRFPNKNPLFCPETSTFEPTKKEANVENINTIPGDDIFYFDCRILPDYNVDDVMAFIHKNVDKIVEKYGVKVE
ncbi:diaminopimelate aminotransferase, partial [Candidatus Peregrinibacteria bacterium CG_4_9_14_0_8_um_filter_44_15]